MEQVAFKGAAELPPGSGPHAVAGGTVLVVEDQPLIRELIVEALERLGGVHVLAAASAADALRLIQANRVDLVFTDIDLGPGPDGFDVARAAIERQPDLPVVYTSGHLRAADLPRAVPTAGFVPKPYRPVQVCDRLTGLLQRRAA